MSLGLSLSSVSLGLSLSSVSNFLSLSISTSGVSSPNPNTFLILDTPPLKPSTTAVAIDLPKSANLVVIVLVRLLICPPIDLPISITEVHTLSRNPPKPDTTVEPKSINPPPNHLTPSHNLPAKPSKASPIYVGNFLTICQTPSIPVNIPVILLIKIGTPVNNNLAIVHRGDFLSSGVFLLITSLGSLLLTVALPFLILDIQEPSLNPSSSASCSTFLSLDNPNLSITLVKIVSTLLSSFFSIASSIVSASLFNSAVSSLLPFNLFNSSISLTALNIPDNLDMIVGLPSLSNVTDLPSDSNSTICSFNLFSEIRLLVYRYDIRLGLTVEASLLVINKFVISRICLGFKFLIPSTSNSFNLLSTIFCKDLYLSDFFTDFRVSITVSLNPVNSFSTVVSLNLLVNLSLIKLPVDLNLPDIVLPSDLASSALPTITAYIPSIY